MTNAERQTNEPVGPADHDELEFTSSTKALEEACLKDRFLQRYLSREKPTAAYLFRSMKAVEARLNSVRPEGRKLDLGGRSAFYKRIAEIPDFLKSIERHGVFPAPRVLRGLSSSSHAAKASRTRF